MVTVLVDINEIVADMTVQARVAIDTSIVCEYSEHLDDLPPLIVYFDGECHWLADGFHRLAAHAMAKRADALCEIRQGTKRDAILHAVKANASHGLRRTNADKRRAVELLLADEEWAQWSDRAIADACGVSNVFVSSIRPKDQLLTVNSSRPRRGLDGKARRLPATPEPTTPPPAPAVSDRRQTEPEPNEPEPIVSPCREPVEPPPKRTPIPHCPCCDEVTYPDDLVWK